MPTSPSSSIDASSERRLEPIASTKLIPPRASRRLMAREALLARLQEARRQRCVVVQGPAGSGKTSTLVAWRQALLALDFDVAWLTLAAEDDDPTRFFECLLASLAELDPALARETALLMGRDSDEAETEHWVITLVQTVAARPRELVLMVDDLHHIDDARIFQALQWLLDYAPPNLHLVLGSRNALPLALGRLRAQALVSEFDLRDLRFTPEESERYLREQLGQIDRRDARVLHELTDGWVAGLQLFAVDMKGRQGTGFTRVQVRDGQAFAGYFEREVLVRLAPDDLELLIRAAACNRFCASLCAALLGQPRALAGMTTRLARLDADNLFVTPVGSHDHEVWYRVHPLLREVLLARLAQRPAAEQQALHGVAWRWFDARGHVDEAVRHAVQAGEGEAAAELVESWAPQLLGRGQIVQVAGLMRRLPAAQVQGRFGLRLAQAQLQLYARNLDALERSLREIEADFPDLDARRRYSLTLLRGGLAMQRDDTDAVRAIAPALEAIPDDAEPHAFSGRGQLLAWMHMNRGEGAPARRLLEQAEQHDQGLSRLLIGRSLVAMSHALEGRMVEAERLLREVLHMAEHSPVVDAGVACVAAGLLSDPLYEANELAAAAGLLEPRIELLERASIPDAVLRALMVLSLCHWHGGRRLEALAYLERLEDYGTQHRLDRLLVQALRLRLRWHLRSGDSDLAEAALQRIVALGERHAGADRGTGAEIVRTAERARIEMSLHWNDFDAAAERLRPMLAEGEHAERWRHVALLHLLLAVAEDGRRNKARAREHLLDALRLGHRLGLLRSLVDASARAPALLQALLQEDILDPVLAFYAQRLLAVGQDPGARAAAPAAAPGTDQNFSEREREVLDLVAQAMPNKKIARALGVTPHTIKWHLRKIYLKLGVTERDEAVARMRDLGLAGGAARAEPRESPRSR